MHAENETVIEHQTGHARIAGKPSRGAFVVLWHMRERHARTSGNVRGAPSNVRQGGAGSISKQKMMMFEGHKGLQSLFFPGKKHYHR